MNEKKPKIKRISTTVTAKVEIEFIKDPDEVNPEYLYGYDFPPLRMTLCPTCANNFYNTDGMKVRRVLPYQMYKDRCNYCNYRDGYDYFIYSKSKGGKS